MDRHSSKHSSSSRHRHSSSSRHHDRDNKRRRSRSRSKSPRYSSSFRTHGKTRHEFEIEVEVLHQENRELRAQLEQYRVQFTNISVAQVQAESRASHWEHESNRINSSYQECSRVLRDLRQGVDELERQKQRFIDEASKAQKERDIADLTSSNYREQMEAASERNTALVKKCESYVEENKSFRGKIAQYETELKELRPALGKLETELNKAERDNKLYREENALLREKEKAWIAERKDLERKLLIKEALNAAERKNNKIDNAVNGEENGVEFERIKRLEMVIDSLQSHYETRIKMLEEMLTEEEDDNGDAMADNGIAHENGIEPKPPASELLAQQLHEATAAVLAKTEMVNKAIKSDMASSPVQNSKP